MNYHMCPYPRRLRHHMIRSVQYLRGVAALMVLLHHVYRTLLINRGYLPDWLHNAVAGSFSSGVDIFFVISGFVIYLSISERPKSPLKFLSDRIARIAPAYWLYSGIFALIIIYYPWTHPSSAFEFTHFIKSLLFIPARNPADMNFYPTLIVGWTLNFEMAFYLIMSISLVFGVKYLHYFILAFLVAINLFATKSPLTEFYGTTRIFEFALGVMIGRLYLTKISIFNISESISTLMLILAFYVLLFVNGDIFLTSGIPSAIIVFSAICLNKNLKQIDFMDRLGDSSYTLYLSHKIFICLAVIICKDFNYGFELMAIPVIIISLIYSFSTFKYVEIIPSKAIKSRIHILSNKSI
ncbi:acyltransferase family protein [Enterobacter cloacae]|uniref:acyltransferase family protein n=1 Tax=Enterobacter cloacae TaxID=550 RepID=UPI002006B09C|nr:acyltransferase [Enterobacter cloacae]MCK7163327.1 acyltransferase [Enterobacter cloacae]